MIFLMNIGNTNTQTGLYSGGTVSDIRTMPTGEVVPSIIPDGISCAASTVVPAVRKKLSGRNIFWLDGTCSTGLNMHLVDTATLGSDRVANIIRLADTSELPAVCLDFGTAITYEIVDACRVFRGGAIAPGRLLLRQSLHNYTAQLPLIPFFDKLPDGAGANTVDAMRLGVDRGAIGSTRELIAGIKALFPDETVRLVGVGGDCKFFIDHIPEIEYGGNDYTLQGIRKAWELNVQ
ncbi:MAG: type III pantothenate kinase [Lentisphaerota bacterium]